MWFGLSLTCAFLTATTAALTKTIIKSNDEFVIGWLRILICCPLFAALFILIPKPDFTIAFWKNIILLLPLELTAFLLYLRSIKISPLSLTFPFFGLTPVFSVVFAHLILKERISLMGFVGIAIFTVGIYLLNANTVNQGLLEPIKRIYKEKGSLLMILAAFIYSITSTLGKKGVLLSTPTVFPTVYFPSFLAVYTVFILFWSKKNTIKIKLNKKLTFLLLFSSVTFMITVLLHFKAISMIQAPYMIAVKRISLLFSVIYGRLVFKEKDMRFRLIGACVMLVGIAILVANV